MWKKLPLNFKLILPLIAVQLVAVGAGTLLVTTRVERSRLRQLDKLLESDADALAELVTLKDSSLFLSLTGELARELAKERDAYFQLLGPDGTMIVESAGQDDVKRQRLRAAISTTRPLEDHAQPMRVEREVWRVLREPIVRQAGNHAGPKVLGELYVTFNSSPALAEIADLRKDMVLSAVVIAILGCLGIGWIVSATTANLRRFAASLVGINPNSPRWEPPSRPQTAEEDRIFGRFGQMMATIKQSVEAQRLFIANASHELKTPVASMLAALEVTLARPRSAEEYRLLAQDLLKTVRQLKRLSTALLDVTQLDRHHDASLAELDFSAHLESVLERWQEFAAERKVRIANEVKAGNVKVLGRPELLEVALSNLIDNAIKYGSSPGTVKITGEVLDGALSVSVADDGNGMHPDDVARLGEVFFRADESRSDPMSFGLGFHQAKKIIESFGGGIVAQSQLGKGTTVTVTLKLPT